MSITAAVRDSLRFKPGRSPVLVVGRWVFGIVGVFALLCLIGAIFNVELLDAAVSGILLSVIGVGLTFVTGFFPKRS